MENEVKITDVQAVVRRLLKAYPHFYKPIVIEAQEWIYEGGEFLWVLLFGSLAQTVKEQIKADNFDDLEKVFDLMEEMGTSGDEDLETWVMTGFMEAMFNNSREDDTRYLECYLGPASREYMIAWEKFHGADTSWLTPKRS